MDGYGSETYGRSFADVYDEWYGDLGPIDSFVDLVVHHARGGQVCELGVGTGRLALPIASRGLSVTGIDSSTHMLERLSNADVDRRVNAVCGDMTEEVPGGPYAVVFIAFNTLFNLTEHGAQSKCISSAAEALADGGVLIVEAVVPPIDKVDRTEEISIRHMSTNRVVLSVSRQSLVTGVAEGHFIELSDGDHVRLRPWSIRYSSPAEIDDMARNAGLRLDARYEDSTLAPFTSGSDRHLSIYRRNEDAMTTQ